VKACEEFSTAPIFSSPRIARKWAGLQEFLEGLHQTVLKNRKPLDEMA